MKRLPIWNELGNQLNQLGKPLWDKLRDQLRFQLTSQLKNSIWGLTLGAGSNCFMCSSCGNGSGWGTK